MSECDAPALLNDLNDRLVVLCDNQVRLRTRGRRATQKEVLSRVEVHIVTRQLGGCHVTMGCAPRSEEVDNVLPEGKALQPFGSHSVLGGHDLAVRAGV